ncbi:hypothetical protein GCM10027615_09690 [Plantactinospora veratri]
MPAEYRKDPGLAIVDFLGDPVELGVAAHHSVDHPGLQPHARRGAAGTWPGRRRGTDRRSRSRRSRRKLPGRPGLPGRWRLVLDPGVLDDPAGSGRDLVPAAAGGADQHPPYPAEQARPDHGDGIRRGTRRRRGSSGQQRDETDDRREEAADPDDHAGHLTAAQPPDDGGRYQYRRHDESADDPALTLTPRHRVNIDAYREECR